jgi:hypothetical protein
MLELYLGKEEAGASKVFEKILINEQQKIPQFAKIHQATQSERRKLAQPGKDQGLPSAVREVQGVQRVTPRTMSPLRRVRRVSLSGCSLSTALFDSG